MIWGIKGKIFHSELKKTILCVHDIYYEVNTLSRYFEDFQKKTGDELFLYCFHFIREDTDELYGFATPEEKEFFITLVNISGIGPKKAMDIVDGNDIAEYRKAIIEGDITPFEKVKGIGKKQAQKILIELAGKIDLKAQNIDRTDSDIINGLKGLGFSDAEINEAFRKGKARLATYTDFEQKFKYLLSLCSRI